MKTRIFIALMLFSANSYSQNVVDLVYKMSKARSLPVDSLEISKALDDFYDTTKTRKPFQFKFNTIDTRNGYVAATIVIGEQSDIEVCYWNMSNGKKLIGYKSYQCATLCYSDWDFFEYSQSQGLKDCNRDVIPNPIITKEDFFDYNLMQKENPEDFEELKEEIMFTYLMKLPRNGKNIRVYFKPNTDVIGVADKLRYQKGRKGIELVWMDGYFKKGDWIKE